MPLTDKAIQAAKPKEKPYKLADFDGLYLLVSPAGGKHWKLKYYYLGKEKKLALGSYPLVTLAEAREKAMAARKMKAQEVDPALEKRKDKARAKLESETTFEVVARAWHAKNVSGWTENHGSYNLRRLERDIFPAFGAMPIKDVTVQDIIGAIRKVEERKAHEVARRLKQMCGQVFRYAIVEGLVQHNPVATFMNRDALKPYSKGHYAAFDASALPDFLRKLERNEARLYAHTPNPSQSP
ncbi:MAG: integrase arm-type DNA-binding domain-containing protein [Pseudomonadaceae bacterium]|nr:integrase arm-type DNA-binding domain-containing protein [Pseudomonadaceae bacterium]